MGPLEGVQDVLGVSQSTASTSAKDQELLLPAFRIVIPLQIKLKKKKIFPGLFMDHKKKKFRTWNQQISSWTSWQENSGIKGKYLNSQDPEIYWLPPKHEVKQIG